MFQALRSCSLAVTEDCYIYKCIWVQKIYLSGEISHEMVRFLVCKGNEIRYEFILHIVKTKLSKALYYYARNSGSVPESSSFRLVQPGDCEGRHAVRLHRKDWLMLFYSDSSAPGLKIQRRLLLNGPQLRGGWWCCIKLRDHKSDSPLEKSFQGVSR